MKLADIAGIRIGLVLSRQKNSNQNIKKHFYKTLTLNSVTAGGTVDIPKLEECYVSNKISPKYLTKEGDVVIRLSEPNTAVFINTELAGLVIPSQFDIIEITRNDVLPEFLALALNSTPAKRQIDQYKSGTSIKTISTSQLLELEIDILSIEEQNRFIEINRLYQKEKKLLNELREQKETLYKGVMNKIYGGIKL